MKRSKINILMLCILLCAISSILIINRILDSRDIIFNKVVVAIDDINKLDQNTDVSIVTVEMAEKINYDQTFNCEFALYTNTSSELQEKNWLNRFTYVVTNNIEVINYIKDMNLDLNIVYEIEESDKSNYQFFLENNVFIIFFNHKDVSVELMKFYRNRFMSVWILYESNNSDANSFAESVVFDNENIHKMNKIVKKENESFNQVLASHRGSFKYKNNSIDAINHAVENGFSIVEIDVSFTADGVPVLFHDNKIELDDGVVDINSVLHRDIYRQRKFDYSYIKEFREILNMYSELVFLVDIKTSSFDYTTQLLELICETQMADNVLLFPNYVNNFNAVKEYKHKNFRSIVNFHLEWDGLISIQEFRRRINYGNCIVSLNSFDFRNFSHCMKKSDRLMIWNIEFKTVRNNYYYGTNAYSVDLR